MIWVLAAGLVLMLAVAYIAARRDILSPWTIACAVFLVSTTIAILNRDRWGVEIQPATVLVVLGGLLALGAGELAVNHAFDGWRPARGTDADAVRPATIEVPAIPLLLFVLFLAAVAYGFFWRIYGISLEGGNPGGFALMLKYARERLLQPGVTIGRVWGHLTLFSRMAGLVFLYIFLSNGVNGGFRLRRLLELAPVLAYVAIGILGTGRTFFIELLASGVVMGFLLLRTRKGWESSARHTMTFIAASFAALAVFFLLFTLTGYLTGKSQLRGAYDTISYYAGMSIPSLDAYLAAPPTGGTFGGETLYGLRDILRTLGFDVEQTKRTLEFVSFNGFNGNVYTALRRYIQDFGMLGMLAMQFLVGVLFNLFYQYLRHGRRSGFATVAYGLFSTVLVMMSIEEKLLFDYASTRLLYSMGYLAVLYLLFVRTPRRRALREAAAAAPEEAAA